jgi:CRISPR-associated endonuclease Csn1
MKTEGCVWAFDLGKGSIGEAVRRGNEFLHRESLLIPPEVADTKLAAARRRMWRTRIAHRERERWLEQVWRKAGLEVLYGRNRNKKTGEWKAGEPGDERLEREFATAGDSTCFTSCLLRIKLLKGDTDLKEWQVFKALRSAIQKRGYGIIPWAEKEARRAGKTAEDLEQEETKDQTYLEALNKWRKFKADLPEAYHFPCYYDAWRMGLWNTERKGKVGVRLSHEAESTRNVRFDREDVEREIKLLAENAARLVPALEKAFRRIKVEGWQQNDRVSGHKKQFDVIAESFGEFLCYGPAGVAFASYSPKLRERLGLHLGSSDDWMGALGQKVPRFDNRILDNCVLIPRYHVCKAEIRRDEKSGWPFPDSLLSTEVTFLMKLKNILVADGKGQRKLRADEMERIFKAACEDVKKVKPALKQWSKSVAECFSLSRADWGKKKGVRELELRPLVGHEEVRAPKFNGRSSYSRPALRLLKQLLLSGKNPRDFHKEKAAEVKTNKDPVKGLVMEDLKFLLDMGESWENIHIPAQKLDALANRHTKNGRLNAEAAVSELLGSIKDPVVRHRLGVFAGRCKALSKKHGKPEEVVLEFIREDFMGPKQKSELTAFQRERENARKEARKQVAAAGVEERSGPLKYELLKAQGGTCLYCGQAIQFSNFEECDIEHIVPRNQGGADAMVNYVLAHHECNERKGCRTPFQWWHSGDGDGAPKTGWDAYVQLVAKHSTRLRNKKVQLLTNEAAPELVQKYTALAETAWVSKLAQTIVSLLFGWKNGIDEAGRRRVTIVSGGLTARVRRKYRLNSILNPCPKGEDPLLWEERCEKKRTDHRHHALDAMVISFIPGWARNASKEHFFRFPTKITRGTMALEIEKVVPRTLCFEKAMLAETIYGSRKNGMGEIIVQRVPVRSLGMKPVGPGKEAYDGKYAHKQVESVRDAVIREKLRSFLKGNPDQRAWLEFCAALRLSKRGGAEGPRIKRVSVNVGQAFEYRDLSKDGTGAYRKGLKGHRGQVVYWDEQRRLCVRPVYAHASAFKHRREVATLGGEAGFFGFFRSDCLVCTKHEIPSTDYRLVVRNELKQKRRVTANKALPPSRLILKTIITKSMDGEMALADGTRVVAPLSIWVKAGLEAVQ